MKSTPLKQLITTILDEMQAIDPIYVSTRKRSVIADGMWIVTARAKRHAQAIADKIVEQLKLNNESPLSLSGYENGEWILVDCGDILIHIMLPAVRAFYDLESLWQAKPPSPSL